MMPSFAAAGVFVGALVRWMLCRGSYSACTRRYVGELGTAALWTIAGWRWFAGSWPWWWLPVALVVTAFAVALTVADLSRSVLPNVLTIPAYPVFGVALALAALGADSPTFAARALLGGLVFVAIHALVCAAVPGALGGGDVKLAGSVGGVLGVVGWPALVLATCFAAVCTLVLTALPPWGGRVTRQAGVPYGPGLLTATCALALFPGTSLEVAVAG